MKGWAHWLTTLMMLLSAPSWAHAVEPAVAIQLELVKKKEYFSYEEPVLMRLVVTNESHSDILITKGFKEEIRNFYRELLIINPDGRRLGISRRAFKEEVPDAPPVPVVFRDGRHIRVVPHELLPRSWKEIPKIANIKDHASLALPGKYSVQFQTSAMIFKAEDPGNIHNYKWQGILKSNIVSFYVKGATKVEVIPDRWQLAWIDTKRNLKDVQVRIWPKEGKTVSDYRLVGITLNDVAASKAMALDSEIRVFFDAREVMRSLGHPKAGRMYQVRIKGQLTTGQPFGGESTVEVVR